MLALVVGVAIAGCSSGDQVSDVTGPATNPAPEVDPAESTPTDLTPSTDVVESVVPVGFSTVEARVTSADGEVCEVCLWLADTSDERSRGLTGVTDLGDAEGMVFVWDAPAQSNFVMIGTPTPLSIAWFDGDGGFVSEADMEPCLDVDSSECERYPAAGSYTAAIEVFRGGLDELGIGPGARLDVLADTEASECSLS